MKRISIAMLRLKLRYHSYRIDRTRSATTASAHLQAMDDTFKRMCEVADDHRWWWNYHTSPHQIVTKGEPT